MSHFPHSATLIDCSCGNPGAVNIEGTPLRFKDGVIDGNSINSVVFASEAEVICILAGAMEASPDGTVTLIWTNERIRFERHRVAEVIRSGA